MTCKYTTHPELNVVCTGLILLHTSHSPLTISFSLEHWTLSQHPWCTASKVFVGGVVCVCVCAYPCDIFYSNYMYCTLWKSKHHELCLPVLLSWSFRLTSCFLYTHRISQEQVWVYLMFYLLQCVCLIISFHSYLYLYGLIIPGLIPVPVWTWTSHAVK